MTEPEIVEDFFGVYLLYCINPKYKGKTYIGYTRDPNRRIKQHNRGTWAGGAYRTSNKGPWKMVMIVHGFPNNISALRFEWAWQNPNKTTRLQYLNLRKIPRKESEYKFKIRVLSEMLRVGPWHRLPLVVRWLEQDYYEEFPTDKKPPSHMILTNGPVRAKLLKKSVENVATPNIKCSLCSLNLNSNQLTCLNTNCELVTHITCLADIFLSPGEFIPIEGDCPFCGIKLKWGDLIRKLKGCSHCTDLPDAMDDEREENSDDDVICTQDREFVNTESWLLDDEDL
ncbi:structure-specific endonuclease subunit SLX1 homolog [Papilio machaon]|uniref:structure-specific endonuclease subunit SLX1 homolog n=1 Tax=Papilio machaon TaxID=76193 RepID=UPI001E664E49|nr:structure-specific endonuclease subunit SLX1 homolog [Papilio machaon]